MSHGPFRMEPGETTELYFAFVWSRGPSETNLNSFRGVFAWTWVAPNQTEEMST